MIYLTRLNGERLVLNTALIESMEETPDTIVTLTTGKKLVVREPVRKIREDIIKFHKRIATNLKA